MRLWQTPQRSLKIRVRISIRLKMVLGPSLGGRFTMYPFSCRCYVREFKTSWTSLASFHLWASGSVSGASTFLVACLPVPNVDAR